MRRGIAISGEPSGSHADHDSCERNRGIHVDDEADILFVGKSELLHETLRRPTPDAR